MKTELTIYTHSENGISLRLIPETDIEKKLLDGLWKHGQLEVNYSGHVVRWGMAELETGQGQA